MKHITNFKVDNEVPLIFVDLAPGDMFFVGNDFGRLYLKLEENLSNKEGKGNSITVDGGSLIFISPVVEVVKLARPLMIYDEDIVSTKPDNKNLLRDEIWNIKQ